jgi:proline dehydrogenase
MPRWVVRKVSQRYIAGETIGAAAETVRTLNEQGLTATVDVLGEAITKRSEASATYDEYLRMIDALASLGNSDLVNVSVKLTALGLDIDRALTADHVAGIANHASRHGGFVRIDMEDSPYTDATLDLYDELRACGCDNLGVVIQSYLHRSEADVERLAATGARVRLVKGIYVEPTDIAWHDMSAINASYLRLARTLISRGSHVAFATHDDALIDGALQLVAEFDLSRDRYEFQMLLGVREDLRDRLNAHGHPVRVYVPFGSRWYEYSVRRLRENPRIARLVARDVLGSLLRPFRRRRKAVAS